MRLDIAFVAGVAVLLTIIWRVEHQSSPSFKMGQPVEVISGFYEGCTGEVTGEERKLRITYQVALVCESPDAIYSVKNAWIDVRDLKLKGK